MTLLHMIAEAVALAGGNLCAASHDWQSEGGRACPVVGDDVPCSQTVYRCARCGCYDHGERGGLSWTDCKTWCGYGYQAHFTETRGAA